MRTPITCAVALLVYAALVGATAGAATVELVSPADGTRMTDVATCFRWKRPPDRSTAEPPTHRNHTRKPLPGSSILQLARDGEAATTHEPRSPS